MTDFQSNNCLLVISDDSFIVGLLTGYSVVNNFTLKCRSCEDPISPNRVYAKCKSIIIDLRLLAPALLKKHLDSLKNINQEYAVPICAIDRDSFASGIPDWIDDYINENLIERLGLYISKYLLKFTSTANERRNKIRRILSDRRTLAAALESQSGSQVNGKAKYQIGDLERYALGDFEIDYGCKAVHLKGRDLNLTGKEFNLFLLLAEDFQHVCTKEKIIKYLWPDTHRANKSDLYQYIHLLRKKIEDDPDNPVWILTVKGVGYKLQTNGHSRY